MVIKKSYKQYSVEDLVHDQDFISAVKSKDISFWHDLIKANSENKAALFEARKVILTFQVSEETIDEHSKGLLWERITEHHVDSGNNRIHLKIQFYRWLSAAAVLILILVAGWHFTSNNQSEWVFDTTPTNELSVSGRPKLVLSDGKEITLKDEIPNIVVLNNKQAMQISSDSIVNINHKNASAENTEALNKIIVPYGESTHLTLSDGTKVWLNAGSQLAFPAHFSSQMRKVYLDGEAYFEVEKDESQQFIVSTNKVNILVYGTTFNVSAYSNDPTIETVLLEGKIALKEYQSILKKETQIFPGQKANYNKNNHKLKIENTESPEDFLSWKEGWYQFSNADLSHVLRKLERFYNIQFIYDENLIDNSPYVSGKLDLKESAGDVLSVLCKVAGIEYKKENNLYFLSTEI